MKSLAAGGNDARKTKAQLIAELAAARQQLDAVRQRVIELEAAETDRARVPEQAPGLVEEATLRASEMRYRRLFETARDGILLLDAATGQITDVNPFLVNMLGYSHAEFVGRHLWEVGPFKDIAESKLAFEQLQRDEYIRYEDLPLETRDGHHVAVEFVSNVYQVNGRRAIQCNVRDITERKRTEDALREIDEKYRSLFANMQEGVALHQIVYDADRQPIDYVIVEVNPTFEAVLGITREQAVGHRATALYGTDQAPYLETYAEVAATGRPVKFVTDFSPLEKQFDISVTSPKLGWFATIFTDITAHQLVESQRAAAFEALHERERKLNTLFEILPVGVSILDAERKTLSMNAALKEILDISTEALLADAEGQRRYLRPDGSPMSVDELAIERALKEKQAIRGIETGIVKGDGNVVWTNMSVVPVDFPDWKAVVVTSDITARKQAEDALRETNQYLNNLFNYANAPIIVWDPQFRITRFNHAFEALAGRSAAEVLGERLEILFPPAQIEASLNLIQKTLSGERWEVVEINIQHVDGSIRTVLWNSATLFSPDEKTPIATIAQGQDITRRKAAESQREAALEALRESEDKFKYVFDNSTVGKSITLPTGEIHVNKAFCQMLGYSMEELQNRRWQEISHPDDLDLTQREMNALLSGEKAAARFTKRYLHKNGAVVWTDVSSSVRRDTAGEPQYFMTTLVDITRRKQAEQRLKASPDFLPRIRTPCCACDPMGSFCTPTWRARRFCRNGAARWARSRRRSGELR